MGEKNRLEVLINGQQYVLMSDRPKKELQEVADFVNGYIHDFQSPANRFNKLSQVTLACLNMGMEYMDQKKAIEGFEAQWEELKNNHQEKQKTNRSLQKNQEELEEKIQELSRIISSKDEEIAKLKREKEELDKEIETLSDHFRTRQKAGQIKSPEAGEGRAEKKSTRAKKTTPPSPAKKPEKADSSIESTDQK